jgi:hypothetical protein
MYNYSMVTSLWAVLNVDLYKYYRKTFLDDVINTAIWVCSSVLISAYVLPKMGMTVSYGAFIAISAIVSSSFWASWGITAQFVSDLEGNRVIIYYLTLPYKAWLFFVKQIIFYVIRSMGTSLVMIPMGKLVLQDRLDLSSIHLGKFIIAFLLMNLFCATLSLLMTSLVPGMYAIDNVSLRFLFPLWFFGGSQYSWHTLHITSELLSYVALANPLLYANEIMRVVFMGQSGHLPFWICGVMLLLFSMVFGFVGTKRLMRQLDCV